MRVLYKVLLNLIIFSCFLLVCYVFQINNNYLSVAYKDGNNKTQLLFFQPIQTPVRNSSESIKFSEHSNLINIWLIFTKVKHKNSPLKFKLKTLISSLLRFSSMNLGLNVISDESSKLIAEDIINATSLPYNKQIQVSFYNIANVTEQLSDLIKTMQPFFTSSPGTYYSDALFFISLGLHRIAPANQKQAIMLDVDTMLKADIALLYKEFQNFRDDEIIGVAPELTPVYQHILYSYRSRNKHTHLGNPISKGGFPGVNSGVLLLPFHKLRTSKKYHQLLSEDVVRNLTKKYSFKGHLGDQDFYTLIGIEFPQLLHLIPCNWNRQLCEWWGFHGYKDVFHSFSFCEKPVMLYHGNCNTPIPRD